MDGDTDTQRKSIRRFALSLTFLLLRRRSCVARKLVSKQFSTKHMESTISRQTLNKQGAKWDFLRGLVLNYLLKLGLWMNECRMNESGLFKLGQQNFWKQRSKDTILKKPFATMRCVGWLPRKCMHGYRVWLFPGTRRGIGVTYCIGFTTPFIGLLKGF